MKKALCILALGFCASAMAQDVEVTLTRIDCGTGAQPNDVGARFSDTFAYPLDMKLPFTFSCYVIKHGADYMIWDTGFAPGSNPNAPKVSLGQRLTEMKVRPEQVKFIGISHYHADHTGQLNTAQGATLLIGKGDWDAVTQPKPAPGVNAAGFTHWISGGGKVEPVTGDKDVFGDGTVLMINTPGHTPGHHSLLVKLKDWGPVLLTGDLTHFHENYDSDGVPSFNVSRADTLASLDRFKRLARNMRATVVIQHDPRDIGKLPAYPEAAK